MSPKLSQEERFWKNVRKETSGECHWIWTRYISPDGYGIAHFGAREQTQHAHRVSWELEKGKVPEEKCVLHECLNRACVNPAHLYLGTRKDNMDRAVAQGRVGLKNRGENAPSAKLNWGKVYEIRDKNASGIGYKTLSKEYGVGPSAIHDVVKRKTWKYPPENH